MSKRTDTKTVKERIRKLGHEPLFDEYEKSSVKLKCKCKKHGIFYTTLSRINHVIKTGKGNCCKECNKDSLRKNIDDIKKLIISLGHEPLFDEYINSSQKLKCRCLKHGVFYATYNKLKRAKNSGFNGCRKCADEINGNRCRTSIEDVKSFVIKMGLVPLFNSYKNNNTPILVKCPIHGEFKITLINLKRAYKSKKNGCINCFLDSIRIKSKEDRYKARDTKEYCNWRIEVFKKDNYTCRCCGNNKKLNAHHILNYASNPELRTDLDNGITLCKKCHIEFHKKYGSSNNTKEQLEDFINLNKNNRVSY